MHRDAVPRAKASIDLVLDASGGARPNPDWLAGVDPDALRCYPDASGLTSDLARGLGVDASRLLVTAGSDDALNRACRAFLGPGHEALLPTPGFLATERWVGLTGARQVAVPWPAGAFPTDAVIAQITSETRMIVVASPNNPTGAVATADDLRRLSAAAPDALLLVDLAYIEFADEDLAPHALALPNALVTRTISKAWGLAGLRVGYAAGPERVIEAMRAVGLPYPVSGPSLALARAALREPARMTAFVQQVRAERARLSAVLREVGAQPQPSQASFVLARVSDAVGWREGLAALGIRIRTFAGRAGLEDAVSMHCPGNERDLLRLERAIRTVAQQVSPRRSG